MRWLPALCLAFVACAPERTPSSAAPSPSTSAPALPLFVPDPAGPLPAYENASGHAPLPVRDDMTLSQEELESIMRREKAAITRACRIGLDAGVLNAHVTVRVTIDPSGHVTQADPSGDNAQVEKCLAEQIRTWPFPTARSSTGPVDFPFKFVSEQPWFSSDASAPFDPAAAAAALRSVSVTSCKTADGPTGRGHVLVSFAPDGTVYTAVVDQPPFAGTAVGGCISRKLRDVHVAPFAGAPVTLGKDFDLE